jgi:hypothetical protein
METTRGWLLKLGEAKGRYPTAWRLIDIQLPAYPATPWPRRTLDQPDYTSDPAVEAGPFRRPPGPVGAEGPQAAWPRVNARALLL